MLTLLKTLKELIKRWWSEFTLQTRLMAVATLVVSLLMSGLTFWAVNSIQQDAQLNDTRFGRDLGLLLAANVAPLVKEGDHTELARFSHQFYSSTSSIRYMLYADEEGDIFFGIPFSESEVKTSLTLRRRMQLPDSFNENAELPMVRQHLTPGGEVTDVFVPINQDGQYLGVMAIGINPNPNAVISSTLTRDVTIAVFVSIWVMVILGAVFNALTITKPIKELLVGVKNISAGNFKQRVDLPLEGELGELILSFNEMAERLERYEEQNIEEMTAEKAKLDTLVSTIADGAVLIDPSLHILLVNPTARRIFSWEGKQLIGENVLYHLPASVTVALTRPLYQLTRGEVSDDKLKPLSASPDPTEADPSLLPTNLLTKSLPAELSDEREGMEFRLSMLEPYNRTVRILLTTVYDQSRENLKGIAMTVQDITREAKLNEAKSQFISNVSHELRTPLFNIKSFIETLHEYGDELSQAEQREFLETANHETDRLTRLVNDVLDLSRLESSRQYHFDAVNLIQPIEQTLRTCQLNARDKGIELNQHIEPDLPTVLGNYDLLLQVFTNLVGNALKFTESGGRVMLRAHILDGLAQGEKPGLLAWEQLGPTVSRQQSSELLAIDAKGKLDHASAVASTTGQNKPDNTTNAALEDGMLADCQPAHGDEHQANSTRLPDEPTSQPFTLDRPPVVRVEVLDTGIGIEKEDQDAIFDRFFRVENRVHTLEGTGLGLSIVRNIVEKHHSKVHLISEVGIGTTFWFDLPIYHPKHTS